MFEFMIYVGTGLRGYWVKLFAKTEKDALDKAKATFSGEYYHVGSAEQKIGGDMQKYKAKNAVELLGREEEVVAASDALAEIEKRDKEIARLQNLLGKLDDNLSAKHDCP